MYAISQIFQLIFVISASTLVMSIILVRYLRNKSLMILLTIQYFVFPLIAVYIYITFFENLGLKLIAYSLFTSYMFLICILSLHFAVEKPSVSMSVLLYCWKNPKSIKEIEQMVEVNFKNDHRINEIRENRFIFKNKDLRRSTIILFKIWKFIAPIKEDG
jgi:hypothetical protein